MVLQELIKRGRLSNGATIADEYPLMGTGVRADIAFLQRRRIIGVEIKTEADSLRRLQKQMTVYENYFDHTLLVVASRHFSTMSTNDFPEVEIWSLGSNRLTTVSSGKRSKVKDPPPLLELITEREKRQLDKTRVGARTKFISAFNKRYGATSAIFWNEAANPIQPEDLHLLSRFKSLRIQQSRQAQDSKNKLQSWINFK